MSSNFVHKLIGPNRRVRAFVTFAIIMICSGLFLGACAGSRAELSKSPDGNTKGNYADRKIKSSQTAQSTQPSSQSNGNARRYRAQSRQQQNNMIGSNGHSLSTMFINRPVSNAVGNIDGVAVAYVLQLHDNAYVSLTLDGAGLGTSGRGGKNRREQQGMGRIETSWQMDEEAKSNPPRFVTPSSPMRTLKRSDDLADELLHTIDVLIRERAPEVKHVYISANMDLFNALTPYIMKAYPDESLQWAQDDIMYHIRRYLLR
ncbi:hypothetical protein [Paenibacillus apiarius]|uniref:hypothetical protein n=1 Tax=Paenibacillus apiarius TaxID=46240 RepID=UPI00197EF6C2|nr:hypothetical protein [Paenibacillus apiarius]MBN3524703.1 hypothetical protein [Paenibacillus apiarius]